MIELKSATLQCIYKGCLWEGSTEDYQVILKSSFIYQYYTMNTYHCRYIQNTAIPHYHQFLLVLATH